MLLAFHLILQIVYYAYLASQIIFHCIFKKLTLKHLMVYSDLLILKKYPKHIKEIVQVWIICCIKCPSLYMFYHCLSIHMQIMLLLNRLMLQLSMVIPEFDKAFSYWWIHQTLNRKQNDVIRYTSINQS